MAGRWGSPSEGERLGGNRFGTIGSVELGAPELPLPDETIQRGTDLEGCDEPRLPLELIRPRGPDAFDNLFLPEAFLVVHHARLTHDVHDENLDGFPSLLQPALDEIHWDLREQVPTIRRF